jgi:hypothetical protein
MTERWMLGALAAGVLLGLAARAAEPVAGWFGLPRRWTWAAAMAGSLLLPVAAVVSPGLVPAVRLPAWTGGPRVQAPGQGSAVAVRAADAGLIGGGSAPSPASLPAAFGVAWLAASLATLGALAWSRRRLRTACGPCVGRRLGGTRVFVSERAGPMVLGLLDPEIVLPRWALDAAEECGLIVRHEREHVLAGDPWLLALASLAVAALPWSPALWWQHRRLRLAVETDCDARVLAAGADAHRYGRLLLSTAARPLVQPMPALAWGGPSSHLERRILAMTARRPRHRMLRAIPLATLACAGAAAACGAASGGPRNESARAPLPMDTTTHTSMWEGRVSTWKNLPDGTARATLGPDPAATGDAGFGWKYDFGSSPVVMRPGDPPSRRSPVYPSVDGVRRGSPAARAGLVTGDVILSSNGVDGREYPLLPDSRAGAAYTFHIRRGSEERDVRLVLGPRAR